ncbi:MAG: DUF2165 domain-containing protein [Ignavibacteria bacterium]|nr:DUF2165 domain-containing protein [Ignavibacteria bacterium]
MAVRISKILLVSIIAINLSLVVVNSLMDYNSNYNFVKHVMKMDTVFDDNQLKWRAIDSPVIWNATYIIIILWEILIAYFCWKGVIKLTKNLKSSGEDFVKVKTPAVIGLTLCLLLFGLAFITVGGEWFFMWQSKTWGDGMPSALRLFTMTGLILIYLNMKE